MLSSGIQYRERVGDGRRPHQRRDGTHPQRHQCRTYLASPSGDALGPGALLSSEVVECLPHHLHHLGARGRLHRLSGLCCLELADLLLQCPHFPLQTLPFLLCFELKLIYQLVSPCPHLLPEGEVLLLPGEISRSFLQGGILSPEAFLDASNVVGLVDKFLLQLLQLRLSRSLLVPLFLQHRIIGFQLIMERCDGLLPLV